MSNLTVLPSNESVAHTNTGAEVLCPMHEGNNPHLVSIGSNVKYPSRIELFSLFAVMQSIQKGISPYGDISQKIQHIRNLHGSPPNRAREIKTNLPWFCASEIVGSRANCNVVQAWYMVFDLDHVADIEATKQRAIDTLPYVLYAFRSANDGVKLLVALASVIRDEQLFRYNYNVIKAEISAKLSLPCDATPDWARACFFSHDPALLHNAACCSYCVQPVPKASEPSREAATRVSATSATGYLPLPEEDEYAKAERVVLCLSQLEIPYPDWIKIGFALKNAFGERGKALWDYFLDNPYYHDDIPSMNKRWKSFSANGTVTIATLYFIAEKYGVRS